MKAVAVSALCLAGPTASGKSALAMALAKELAHELPLEIISVDSALVYKGMDIGTAKPSAAERAAVPHHLIDLLDPLENYSAARFVTDTMQCVADVRARGKLPLLVGGTLLYFKALRQGLHAMPGAHAGVRVDIEARAAAQGWPALHAELARVDPATAARLAPADSQRIQRALEVWQVSGRPLSAWHRDDTRSQTQGAADWPLLSLEPASRAWLHGRIAQRFEAMLDAGLVAEVQALRARGDLHAELPSMRCVGYRQAWQALDSGRLDGLREQGIAATRQLAKRQLTGLRSMPSREVVLCDQPGAADLALQRLLTLARGQF